jgi:hypothetical protein
MLALLVVPPPADSDAYVGALRGFVPAVKEDYVFTIRREIDPVARPEVDLVFRSAFADCFGVAKISSTHSCDSGGYRGLRTDVSNAA